MMMITPDATPGSSVQFSRTNYPVGNFGHAHIWAATRNMRISLMHSMTTMTEGLEAGEGNGIFMAGGSRWYKLR